ncbi:MAG: hypothetical protein KC620_08165 [Myxococcales bacterium]|nr:hypothetical protein [Myxococcales bacterium]
MSTPNAKRVDIAWLTALPEEYEQVLRVDTGALDDAWTEHPDGHHGRIIAERRFRATDGHPLHIVTTWAAGMGGHSAAATATQMLYAYQPRCIVLSGFAAGPRGKVNLGDVVFGRFVFTYDSGKITDGGYKGDPNTYRLDPHWRQRVEQLCARQPQSLGDTSWLADRPLDLDWQASWILHCLHCGEDPWEHPDRLRDCPDWALTVERLLDRKLVDDDLALTDVGRTSAKRKWQLNRARPEPRPAFKVHFGDIATGSAVRADAGVFAQIHESMRKTMGLEMEAAAVAAAAAETWGVPALIAKGIGDFADATKDDRFHDFANRASAECLMALLRQNADLLRDASPNETPGENDPPAPAEPIPTDAFELRVWLQARYPLRAQARKLAEEAGLPTHRIDLETGGMDVTWFNVIREASLCEGGVDRLRAAIARDRERG